MKEFLKSMSPTSRKSLLPDNGLYIGKRHVRKASEPPSKFFNELITDSRN
jgi:hypothetical protein